MILTAEEAICGLFAEYPDIIFGFADISYSQFAEKYKSALVFAVPYGEQLTPKTYTEERFENGIQTAKARLENMISRIEKILSQFDICYYVPPAAQSNETGLLAPFSFKFAAVNAGLGWIGKNDVLITPAYGPRVRLSAVLLDLITDHRDKITECRCPDDCRRCIEACPCKALYDRKWNINAKREDIIDYHRCNRMRSAYINKLGRKSACGLCLAACPFGITE